MTTRSTTVVVVAILLVVGLMIAPAGTVSAQTSPDTSAADQPEATVDGNVTAQIDATGSAPVIVQFDTETQAVSARQELTVEATKLDSAAPLLTATVDAAGLDELRTTPGVVTVTEDRAHTISLATSAPAIEAPEAWDRGYTGAGYRVAILDTGVLRTHPFLQDRVTAEACFSGANDPGATGYCPGLNSHEAFGMGAAHPCDTQSICWHGTHVAGIAAGGGGPTDAPSGIAPDADIIAVQVFHRTQQGAVEASDSDLIKAMQWVASQQNAAQPIVAVNLSLGGAPSLGTCDSRPADAILKSQIDALASVGIAVVAATGNDGIRNPTSVDSPACISTTIAVGATDDARAPARFSNAGTALDVLAPGTNIMSSAFTGSTPVASYRGSDGTSMAAPHVTGAIALLAEARGTLPVSSFAQALTRSGIPVTDPKSGVTRPFIQVDAALDMGLSPVGQLESSTTASGSATLTGWALDPDTTDAADVEVRVGGVPVVRTPADRSRPDIAAAYPTFGPLHGFAVTVPGLTSGPHSICLSVIDTFSSVRRSLDCRTLWVTGGPPPPPNPFSDVAPGSTFFESIVWLAESGITTGFDDGSFQPISNLSRQSLAAFLYRLAAPPAFTPPAVPTFDDVGVGHPFRTEIEWAASKGITTGFDDGSFRPTTNVSRQAFAAFLYRLAESPPYTGSPTPTFTDVGLDHVFHAPIEWMASQGIADGNTDGSFGTIAAISRQALAAFLARYEQPTT